MMFMRGQVRWFSSSAQPLALRSNTGMAIIIMIRKRIVRDTLGRIGRFMFLLFVRMKPGDPAKPESPRLAFGLALCIGAGAALVLVCIFGPDEKMFLLGI